MLDSEKVLDDLMFNGFTEQTFDILNGKAKVTLKSLDTSEEIAVKHSLQADDNAIAAYFIQSLAVKLAAAALRSFEYKGTTNTFGSVKEAEAFLNSRSAYILDEVKRVQVEFEKELKAILSPEKIEENFSQTQPTATA